MESKLDGSALVCDVTVTCYGTVSGARRVVATGSRRVMAAGSGGTHSAAIRERDGELARPTLHSAL